MNLQNLVAISGKSGIFKMVGNRPNGLVVQALDSNKRFFVAGRSHQFTPLESISIYTETEENTTQLKDVFGSMLQLNEQTPPPSAKASSIEIKNYFSEVLPDYDRDKVLLSDIKKIIKWFYFLSAHDLLTEEEEEVVVEEEKTEEA